MIKLKCFRDVVMNDGSVSFHAGQEYDFRQGANGSIQRHVDNHTHIFTGDSENGWENWFIKIKEGDYKMNIDLGWLGKVVLEDVEPITPAMCSFTVVADGYTESGIRVQGVLDSSSDVFYPKVWQNAILIKLGDS